MLAQVFPASSKPRGMGSRQIRCPHFLCKGMVVAIHHLPSEAKGKNTPVGKILDVRDCSILLRLEDGTLLDVGIIAAGVEPYIDSVTGEDRWSPSWVELISWDVNTDGKQ